LGSALGLADSSGGVQTEYTYEPFGNTTVFGNPSVNPIQYTGRENDGTALYYYRARYYHPELHRFISEDPLQCWDITEKNLYAYVSNNPVRYSDPLGLTEQETGGPGVPELPTPDTGGGGGMGGRKDSYQPQEGPRQIGPEGLGTIVPIADPGAPSDILRNPACMRRCESIYNNTMKKVCDPFKRRGDIRRYSVCSGIAYGTYYLCYTKC
jgi:RHS repeat-associated protein